MPERPRGLESRVMRSRPRLAFFIGLLGCCVFATGIYVLGHERWLAGAGTCALGGILMAAGRGLLPRNARAYGDPNQTG